MVCIVIVDSHEEYRNYLCDHLSHQKDFKVAGAGSDSYEAIKLVDAHKPDVVVMDVNLPQGDGGKTVALIKYRSPNTQVILSGNGEERHFFSVLLSGVSGYITKQIDCELLCHGIRAVYYGGSLISPELAVKFKTLVTDLAGNALQSKGELHPTQSGRQKQPDGKYSGHFAEELPRIISPSEIQIMCFVGQGHTNKEIADELGFSEGTVRNYVSSLLQKLGFRDRTQLAIYTIKTGLSIPL